MRLFQITRQSDLQNFTYLNVPVPHVIYNWKANYNGTYLFQ